LLAVSASLRSVAVATPPTPPVLHTAALGASGPGSDGQFALDVHCAPVKGPATGPHLPSAGQLTASTPGVVHAALEMLQTPAVGGHWLLFAQLAPLVLHVPTFGQSWFA
jgi:hypothetical protein